MIKHTHTVTIRQGDYKDSFGFTPSEDARRRNDVVHEVQQRVNTERGTAFGPWDIAVVELPSAADTRARGKLVEAGARRYYEI